LTPAATKKARLVSSIIRQYTNESDPRAAEIVDFAHKDSAKPGAEMRNGGTRGRRFVVQVLLS